MFKLRIRLVSMWSKEIRHFQLIVIKVVIFIIGFFAACTGHASIVDEQPQSNWTKTACPCKT